MKVSKKLKVFIFGLCVFSVLVNTPRVYAENDYNSNTERGGNPDQFTGESKYGNPTEISQEDLIIENGVLKGVKQDAYKKYWDLAMNHNTPVTLDLHGMNITSVGENAVNDLPINILKVPEGITSIGAGAFKNNLIVELDFDAEPESITIGKGAFDQVSIETVLNGGGYTDHDLPYYMNLNYGRRNPKMNNRYMPAVIYTELYYKLGKGDVYMENPIKIKVAGKVVANGTVVDDSRTSNGEYLQNIGASWTVFNDSYMLLSNIDISYSNINLKGKMAFIKSNTMYVDLTKMSSSNRDYLLRAKKGSDVANTAIRNILYNNGNLNSVRGFDPYYTANGMLAKIVDKSFLGADADEIVKKIQELADYDYIGYNSDELYIGLPENSPFAQPALAAMNNYKERHSLLEKKRLDFALISYPVKIHYRYIDINTGKDIGKEDFDSYVGLSFPKMTYPDGYEGVYEKFFDPNQVIEEKYNKINNDYYYRVPVKKKGSNLQSNQGGGSYTNIYPRAKESYEDSSKNPKNRISGNDRVETSIELSAENFNKSPYVFIASGRLFPDALTGGVLASLYNAPILLSNEPIEDSVISEIQRLGARKIFIIGGYNTLSPRYEEIFKSRLRGIDTERIAGRDRYGTSVEVANKIYAKYPNTSKAVLASGETYPDALTSSVLAAKMQTPLYLARKQLIPSAVKKDIIEKHREEIIIAGGRNTLDDFKINSIKWDRIAGRDRYETAVKIELYTYPNSVSGYLASGENFADALSIVPVAAKNKKPVLLTSRYTASKALIDYVNKNHIVDFIVVGGNNSVSNKVYRQLFK